ncbi:hypothetical protein G6F61_005755 [Rhizopus arrhizus]|nr:hypothetical protein G6F61_005755 [Rhizopus arrhizus]
MIASWAWEANFKQVVDISSILYAEKALFELSDHGSLVTLWPGRFMTMLTFDHPKGDFIFGTADADKPQGRIPPNYIGAIAAVIFGEDIKKHDDLVYELNEDVVNPT